MTDRNRFEEFVGRMDNLIMLLPEYRVGEPVRSCQERLVAVGNGRRLEMTGTLTVTLQPEPHHVIHLQSAPDGAVESLFPRFDLEFPDRGARAEVGLYRDDPFSTQVVPIRGNIISEATHAEMCDCVFWMVNVSGVLSEYSITESVENNVYRRDFLFTDIDEWTLCLGPFHSGHRIWEELNTLGHYGVTGFGRVARKDGSTFSSDKLLPLLEAIHHWASFAQGSWVAPLLPTGFSVKNVRLWQDPGIRIVKPFKRCNNWFDRHTTPIFERSLRLFWTQWKNGADKDTLHELIYWYLRANDDRAGIDGNIILSQLALEQFAYRFLVLKTKVLSKTKFNNSNAAERIRRLLQDLDVPTEVPESLESLHELSSRKSWRDGPEALAKFRNEIVHHQRKNLQEYEPALADMWSLSLWFIELAILSFIGYSGPYGNRLVTRYVGETELLPWSS